MNYIGVVQVKFGSSGLPGRSLASIGNETVLEFLLHRLKKASFLSKVLVATTPEADDDQIVEMVRKAGIEVYRGESADVLKRLYGAVKDYSPKGVVKILGNSPLVDIDEMKFMVMEHDANGYDYSYNEHARGVIFGMGCSVFSLKVLESLALSGELTDEQREIGSLYIRQHQEKFKILKRCSSSPRPLVRVYLDEMRDVELIKSIVKYVPVITNEAVGAFLDENTLLTEYQKGSGISETGLEKMFLFPEKITGYMNGSSDTTYPVSVELSLTNNCNFDCVWCSDGNLRTRLGGELSLDDIRRLFRDLEDGGTKGVVIEGGGEPAIHKDFQEIVRIGAECGLSLGLITNGSMHLPEDIVTCFEWIRVSLDAATPEQHASAKKVKMFEKVMKTIKFVGQHKGKTTVGVGYVVTNANTENLENLLLRLRNYSVDYIQFRPVIDNPDLWPSDNLLYLKKYETAAFKVDLGAMDANNAKGNGGRPCYAHSMSSVITADGGVYLCGRLNIYDWVKPTGNLHQHSFRDIWLGAERMRQSQAVSDPQFCKEHCPECRMTKYNLLIDRIKSFKTKSFI